MGSDGKSFPTLLLLEIDGDQRTVIARALRNQGYNVLEADGLPEALQVAKTHSRRIQLLVSGLRCDEAFMDRMQQFRPKMELMLFTRAEMFHSPNLVIERIVHFFSPAKAEGQSNERSQKGEAGGGLYPARTRTADAS